MHLQNKEIEAFSNWLTKCGAELLSHTNEWEIIRIKAEGETLVSYKNAKGRQKWPPSLVKYHKCFSRGKSLKLASPITQYKGNKKARLKLLGDRDGWSCWYCDTPLWPVDRIKVEGEVSATIEEVCPRQIGGPTHIGNQVLACAACNSEAGNMSVAAKVVLREVKRQQGTFTSEAA